ncbi:hypothetical protein Tco_0921712 [Tanacetum coccineum]
MTLSVLKYKIVERIGFLYILKDSKEQKDNKDDLERKKEIRKIRLQNLMKLAPFNDAGLCLNFEIFLYPGESSSDNPRERKRQTGFGWNLESLDVVVVTKMAIASDVGHDNFWQSYSVGE